MRRPKFIIAAAALIIMIGLWLFIAAHLFSRYRSVRSFSQEEWKQSDPVGRFRMIDDLRHRQLLMSLSPPQVEELLGRPDVQRDGEYVYYVDDDDGFGGGNWRYLLEVRFKENKVVEVILDD